MLGVLFAAGCNSPNSAPADTRTGIHNDLQYYGFALVDCGWDDPHDPAGKTNYIDEVAGFTNVGQMCVYAEDESIADRVTAFQRAGVKPILHIEALLFEQTPDGRVPSGTRAALRHDAASRWTHFVEHNRSALGPEHIAALYVADEPVWNGITRNDFIAALDLVKTALPDIPTLAIEAYPVVTQIMVPDTLDWLGFDRYDSVDPVTDPAWRADLETVRAARTRPDQRIVIVASTQ